MRISRTIKNGIIFSALAFSLLITGCSKNGVTGDIVKIGSGVSGTVTIAGSTSAQALSKDLGLIFMAKNEDAIINVSGGDSYIGVKATQTKTVDFGAVSREVKPEETDVTAVKIANDGLALIVSKDNPVSDLTLEQIKDIYNGNITNWSQVGGNDATINLFNREEGSGSLEVFREKVLEKQNGKNGTAYNSSAAIIDAVGYDKNAIGYVSFSALNNKVKYLKINEIELTASNIKNNKYPLVRPLYYVYNSSLPLSDQAQAFLDFVLSEEGQKIIGTHGYAPIK